MPLVIANLNGSRILKEPTKKNKGEKKTGKENLCVPCQVHYKPVRQAQIPPGIQTKLKPKSY